MNDHQIRRESSDTFGRNTRADLELMRRMAELQDNRGENMLAIAMVAAAVLTVAACVAAVACLILN